MGSESCATAGHDSQSPHRTFCVGESRLVVHGHHMSHENNTVNFSLFLARSSTFDDVMFVAHLLFDRSRKQGEGALGWAWDRIVSALRLLVGAMDPGADVMGAHSSGSKAASAGVDAEQANQLVSLPTSLHSRPALAPVLSTLSKLIRWSARHVTR